jgi:hypothetical protein
LGLIRKEARGSSKALLKEWEALCANLLQVGTMADQILHPTNEFQGACGLVSYGLVGAYKQVKASSAKASEGDAVEPGAIRILELGDAEYEMASEQTRVEVVRRWCQLRRETENGW